MRLLLWSTSRLKAMSQDSSPTCGKRISRSTLTTQNTIALYQEFHWAGITKICTSTSASLERCIRSRYLRRTNGKENVRTRILISQGKNIKNGNRLNMRLGIICLALPHLSMQLTKRIVWKTMKPGFYQSYKLQDGLKYASLTRIWN